MPSLASTFLIKKFLINELGCICEVSVMQHHFRCDANVLLQGAQPAELARLVASLSQHNKLM